MEPVYRYRAEATRVVDGDTLEVEVDLGFYVRCRIKVRLRGVDTPERGQEGWEEAKDFLNHLTLGEELVLESYKDRRTFERWVCDVYDGDGLSLAQQIIESGRGVPA